ncbi:HYR domain-containing protein [Draconibacterium halophilum]|uniref:HYR domain-containing protein n=1 Tax=Draconibacterium halophilum TaxID=2706887 RepID=A0A6C0R8T8_9BACT|nr:HYR domain-containing protein [Draconibacterium halophilum]QIA06266.1 HYR domain-containing protein [Draconibacterium halophilum]
MPPSLNCPPDVDTTADFGEQYNSSVILQVPVYADNCPDPELAWSLIPPVGYESEYNSGERSGSGIYVSPDTFWVGETTIWYYVEDSNGNRDSCSFTVTVQAAPDIDCPPDTTIYLNGTENNCETTFDPGIPGLIQGVPPIEWTYTVSFADGRTDLTGNYTSPAPGNALTLGDIDFPVGVTTISWRAENVSGFDTCSHWIEVIDTIPPTFTTAPYENCVDPLHWAVYSPGSPNPVYNHTNPLLEKSPVDYRTMFAGDEYLNLLTLEDNCCDSTEMIIHWRIEFSDTPDPQTGDAVTHDDISGTGQPASYRHPVTDVPTDIYLWGDGVTFTEVVHHIFYWVEDCNGNTSETVVEEIIITPRPEIIKTNY